MPSTRPEPAATDIPALLERLAAGGVEFIVIGAHTIRCVSLRRLIALKRAAGRPKDLIILGELEALLDERERNR